MKIPNGFFINDLLFFGESLSSETVLSKGFFLEFPDTRSLSINKLNELHHQIKIFLAFLGDEYSMQVQWGVNNDYQKFLENYKNIKQCDNQWSDFCRKERYFRYQSMVEEGKLRKEKLAIFLSKKCNTLPKKPLKVRQQIELFVKTQEKEFSEKIKTISQIFPEAGIYPMTDRDHYSFYKSFLNPSLNQLFSEADFTKDIYNSELSILENTLASDGICTNQEGHVFFKLDDFYHAILVIRKWPRQTYPGIIQFLTNIPLLNYTITQNIFPLSIEKEINKEEKEMEWLEAVALQSKKNSLFSVIAKKERKIQALMDGYILPYEVLTVIRVWEKDLKELSGKMLSIKAALGSMNGTYYHQVNHPAQAQSIFYETFPGWTGGSTRVWDIYAQSDYLADLLPFSSTFLGSLDTGEALYDGVHDNIVGISTFLGNTPQHAVLIGMTGAGKSIAICDLLSQTEPFYGFTAIIEEGLSYGVYTKLMGTEPIIIHPDSGLTLNYFDTNRLPLTNEHISVAASICLKMIGIHADESINNMRLSMLCEYINQLYWEKFEEWQYMNPSKFEEAVRWAKTLTHYKIYNAGKSFSIVEKIFELIEKRENQEKDFLDIWNRWSEVELIEFSKDFNYKNIIRDISYRFFGREDCPTHTQLVEAMQYAKLGHHDSAEVNYLATLLAAWTKNGGKYGCLFDGVSNVNLKGAIVHFELGFISESANKLKETVGFLISNYIRQHIIPNL